jgi:hypothetical protein
MAENRARERGRPPRDSLWMKYAETLLERSRSRRLVVNNSTESTSSIVSPLKK